MTGSSSVSHPLGQTWQTEDFTSARGTVAFSYSQQPPKTSRSRVNVAAPLQTQARGGWLLCQCSILYKMGVWRYPTLTLGYEGEMCKSTAATCFGLDSRVMVTARKTGFLKVSQLACPPVDLVFLI